MGRWSSSITSDELDHHRTSSGVDIQYRALVLVQRPLFLPMIPCSPTTTSLPVIPAINSAGIPVRAGHVEEEDASKSEVLNAGRVPLWSVQLSAACAL